MKIRKIYLDMDGVLADFDRGVAEICGMEPFPDGVERDPQQDHLMWEAIREAGHFYDRLEPMPGAVDMFHTIYGKYGDRCEILTGIPKPSRGIETAAEDKVNWMHRVLSPEIVVHCVLRREKTDFCDGAGTILIDDREKTIDEWNKKGGTGILHRTAEETLRILKTLEAAG
ncbi:MAG: hypothetical protein ABTB30_00525 [Clostridia bacterium]